MFVGMFTGSLAIWLQFSVSTLTYRVRGRWNQKMKFSSSEAGMRFQNEESARIKQSSYSNRIKLGHPKHPDTPDIPQIHIFAGLRAPLVSKHGTNLFRHTI
jgi:hypothetical protein